MSQIYSAEAARSRRPDPRNERSRSACRAALVRLLGGQAFEDIVVRQIAEEAGVGYATFFRHYRDKADLLEDVTRVFLDEAGEAVIPLFGAGSMRDAAMAICRFIDENRLTSKILLTGGASGTIRQEFAERVVPWASEAPRRPSHRLPGRLAIVFPLTGIVAIISWWLSDAPDMPIQQVADLIERLVLVPMGEF